MLYVTIHSSRAHLSLNHQHLSISFSNLSSQSVSLYVLKLLPIRNHNLLGLSFGPIWRENHVT